MLPFLGGCEVGPNPAEAALVFVVRDMQNLMPRDVVDIQNRFLGEIFLGGPPDQVIPESVRDASGLSVVSESEIIARDSTIVVLALFLPLELGGDSLRVTANWLVFEGEPQEMWGDEYNYFLVCNPNCALVRRDGPGHLN